MVVEGQDEWEAQENHGKVTNPETGVSQNGDVFTSLADDAEREEK